MKISIKVLIGVFFMVLTRKCKFNIVFYAFSAAHVHTFVHIILGVNFKQLQVDGMSQDNID